MPEQRDVAVIVGSLRKDSLNRRMAHALAAVAPEALRLEIVEIRDLPLYDQDLDTDPPAPWVTFRERLRRADAVLFVTPEYNRSMPGALKNALDVGSRPPGQSGWKGKPGAVMTVSPGALGGFGANHHLRQTLVALNVPTMPHPEAYVGQAGDLFDADGKITSDRIRDLTVRFMAAFGAWVEANAPKG
ncbi:MAG TPA: NAD(P)H-dependent oxidoreductase [Thermoanaerobaculia bacterium]|nr:NAD(P)H-dependent oxidoreductase [Thermoanaerobaculia bacterium]